MNSDNKKLLLKGAIALLVVWLLYEIIEQLFGGFSNLFKPNQGGATSTDTAGTDAQSKTAPIGSGGSVTPSLSQLQINQMADSIFSDLNNAVGLPDYTSDALNNAFNKIHNDADIAALIKAFGTRSHSILGVTTFKGDLSTWFNSMNVDLSVINAILDQADQDFPGQVTFRF